MARIFVIEDDKTIAELVQVALQHEGHQVHLELGGDLSALDDTYDLVLLDLTLPDIDGLELAKRISRGVRSAHHHADRARPAPGQVERI